MWLIVLGALSLTLWVRFCLPAPGKHTNIKEVPGFWLVVWLTGSIVAMIAGYIMIAT